ncbi:MAG: hypothetical protein EBR82_65145 [Caulobacteraceae bacterium]|nr:hypothetical protein [Caulobacteraceae bacterium]
MFVEHIGPLIWVLMSILTMRRVVLWIIAWILCGLDKMRMIMPRLLKRPWNLQTLSDPFVVGMARRAANGV